MLQESGLSSSLPPSSSSSSSTAKIPIPSPRHRTKPSSASGSPATGLASSPHISPTLSPHPRPPSRTPPRSKRSNSPSDEEETPLTLEDFVLEYSTLLPLQMKVKRGYHGGDEKHSIATDDVYNVHFIKRTKVVVLKDRRGATFNIPLNSAVQFAPVFNPSNDPREPAKGASFEKVSDLISLKTLPTVVRATKPHIRVDSKSTVEQSELFIVQSVVSLSVRKKALKVYSITCNQEKLLLPDSMGAFSTDPSIACLYLLEIMEHFLNRLPLDVRVVLSNCDVIREELPFYLTNEVATLSHLDSEISLIASTNWGENEVVCEEGQMPVEIPVDLPIQLVVQTPDGAREAHLSHHTKRLYERFDPSRIRLLKTRNIRRGFEKEGMELQRPERIYDIPDVSVRRNRSPQAVDGASRHKATPTGSTHMSVSPQQTTIGHSRIVCCG